MPIRPENRGRYLGNWKTIRQMILARAADCCEFCGLPNRAWKNKITGATTHDIGLVEAWRLDGYRAARIVLTVAHLDHVPEHNDPANLRALCQRCHNRHDQRHRIANAAEARRKRRADHPIGQGDLFGGTAPCA